MTDGPAPRRAKLELLVRQPGDDGFQVREVASAPAFVQSRPQRVPAEEYELAVVNSRVGQQRRYILKHRQTDRFLLLSDAERFLWEQMDGATSLQEMATAYVLKYGEFNFEILPALIRKLQHAHLLTMRPASRLRRALARNRRPVAKMLESGFTVLERVVIASRNVQPFFQRLYRWGGFLLFTRVAALACLLLGVAGLLVGVRLWSDAEAVAAGLGTHPVMALLSVKVLFILTLAVHQVVHGLACVHYGRRVREFGFTFLHGFVPTFYVDVTDIFMTSRRARVVTAVSGALVHLVLGSVWFLIAAGSPPGFTQAFAATSGIVQWQAFALALYPFCFIEMDGYHVLVDVLGAPTLKHDALAFVGGLLRGHWPAHLTREEGVWIGYVALSTVSVAVFIAFNLWLVISAMA
jgi:putative peptide zinc metalloprotease protein